MMIGGAIIEESSIANGGNVMTAERDSGDNSGTTTIGALLSDRLEGFLDRRLLLLLLNRTGDLDLLLER